MERIAEIEDEVQLHLLVNYVWDLWRNGKLPDAVVTDEGSTQYVTVPIDTAHQLVMACDDCGWVTGGVDRIKE